jgi:hypothetical protein
LRPEFKRAGLDSLKFPTKTQISNKLEAVLYYNPKHEQRGTMYNNPLIKQNVLQDAMRFRKTDSFPRETIPISLPTETQSQRVASILQGTYNQNQLKLNNNTATPVMLSTPMMTSLHEFNNTMTDVYVPAQIQAGGAPFTRAGRFNS